MLNRTLIDSDRIQSVPLMLDPGIDIAQQIPMSVSTYVASGMDSGQFLDTNSVVYHSLLHAIPRYLSIPTLSYVANDRVDSPTIA